jgi:hypothetical protein
MDSDRKEQVSGTKVNSRKEQSKNELGDQQPLTLRLMYVEKDMP